MPTTLHDSYLDIGHAAGTNAILWTMASDYTVASFKSGRPERDGHHQFAGYDLSDDNSDYGLELRRLTNSKAWCDKYWKNSIASGRFDLETGHGSISCTPWINSKRLDRFVVPALERHLWQRYSRRVEDWWVGLSDTERWYYCRTNPYQRGSGAS